MLISDRAISCGVVLLACPALAAQAPVGSDLSVALEQEGESLADWSIEDLLRLRIPSMTSVLGGHVHNEGEWMPMIRAMTMRMDGLRDGTDDVSTADVLDDFAVAPTEMTTDAVMVGLMYGWSDRLTLMGMLPYIEKSMDHRTAATAFTTRSEGIGDLELSGLQVLWEGYDAHLHLNLGVSVPTGSTDERDATPMGSDQKLPYPMQLGSGTFDLKPGLTFVSESDPWGLGAQASATLRLGRNDEEYSLGDRFDLKGWVQRKVADGVAVHAEVGGAFRGDVDGADPELNPAMAPTADPSRQGGARVDLSVGVELYSADGRLAGHALDVRIGAPILEDLDGPQMSADWWASLSWSVTL